MDIGSDIPVFRIPVNGFVLGDKGLSTTVIIPTVLPLENEFAFLFSLLYQLAYCQ
jgi:hypothetical protein